MPWTTSEQKDHWSVTAGLVALYLIAAGAAVGFGVFRAWPHLLATVPDAMSTYPAAVQFFSRGQVVIAFAVLAAVLIRRTGARWLPAFAAVYAISLASELLGTTVGLPFGAYSYTGALGPKLFGHVPVLIPASWFMMALPSYALAASAPTRAARVVIAALILLAWDLVLDPAMSGATAFWVWESTGPYYGMPWLNLFGWFVTGLALMAVLAAMRAERWADLVPRRWMAAYYGANLALPLGIALAAGMWLAVAATLGALAACLMLPRLRWRERVFA